MKMDKPFLAGDGLEVGLFHTFARRLCQKVLDPQPDPQDGRRTGLEYICLR